ncbi:MAG: hypothetical protein U1E40_14585 [Amaricoccus sp.]
MTSWRARWASSPTARRSFTSTRALLTEVERAFMSAGRRPARDRTDPSHHRPLRVDPARRDRYRAMVA